ncbi:MAG: biosynthetic-type acetolactate synthase large subunit [Chloroflexi bacterium]|nr:biosynthetic-type acetolactate synthase large subunit [Chloroflexota bacterium]
MKLNGAQIVYECLRHEGVDTVFGYPGGVVIPLYDELPNYPDIHHILVRHEQGAAHAADGYARATGKTGVAFATSGPGATNLVTGIATAFADSIPTVFFTGQVVRSGIGTDFFQEVDITGITLPVTKHNYLVLDVRDLAKTIKEAFYIASSGRPGPVLIDIPKDVFTDACDFSYPDNVDLQGYKPTVKGNPYQIKKAAALIAKSQKPVIVAGNGVIGSNSAELLKELAEKTQMPVVTTLLGKGAFPEDNELSFGMLGMHGTAWGNKAVLESDLLVAIGMRFDDRATSKLTGFAPNAKVIHIDVDPAEIGKNVKVDVPIVGNIKQVLLVLNEETAEAKHDEWINTLKGWKKQYFVDYDSSEKLLPQYILHNLSRLTDGNPIIVTGVGQHQMWAAMDITHKYPRHFISSGGLGTMGFDTPAAMGVKAGCPHKEVISITGDGSLQMTIQEFGTIMQEQLGIKIFLFNNNYLGMVRQWQDLFYNRRYVATPLANPDFGKIAEAYNIPSIKVEKKADVEAAIIKALSTKGPFLIDFHVEREENVFPMIPPGAALCDTLINREEGY